MVPFSIGMKATEQIKNWAEEKLIEFPHLFLVDLLAQNLSKIEILVDGDKGINVAECADISRFVNQNIEEHDLIQGAYVLDVCSPGVDYPIKLLRQLPKHIGRNLELTMEDGTVLEAKFIDLQNEELKLLRSIKEKGKKAIESELSLDFKSIKKIKVLVSFK